jgi:hypothetical protein
MKSFQQLKKNLLESENTEGGGFNAAYDGTTSRSAASDFGIFRVENQTQRNRLQAFLNAFGSRDYLDPRSAIALLRAKLNLAGLDFDFNPNVPLMTDTEMKFPLRRFGGIFGQSPTEDISKGFFRSDGIAETNNGKGLMLVVLVTLGGQNGLYKFSLRFEDSDTQAPHKL